MFSFSDPDWRPFPSENPGANQLWFNASAKAGALIVNKSSQFAEYALSQARLDRLYAAERDGRVTFGYVVLAKWERAKRVVVHIRPVAEVVAELDGIPPREGPLGPYWWMNANLTSNVPRPIDKLPF